MTYNLNLYTKIQGWTKQEVIVEAETIEDAINLVKDGDCDYGEWEYLYDAEDVLACELEDLDGKIIAKWQ